MAWARHSIERIARGVALLAAGAAPLWGGGCADIEETGPVGPDLSSPAPLLDTDPDPDVVEVWLTATTGTVEYLPGKPAHVWAYRDGAIDGSAPQVPGPLLEAKLGDLVRVHLANELPDEGTTLHMHGLRLPADMDGAHGAVLPGERFDYEFVARDSGAFFYHPHIFTDVQLERGLYGPVLVRPDTAPAPAAERVLVLDDVKLGDGGDLAGDWTEDDIAMGRRGNLLLVNGRPSPTLHAPAGERQRWHFINASNGRYFKLAMADHAFEVIGWDSGAVDVPYAEAALLIAPGERFDVMVRLGGSPGETLDVRALPYDRGEGPDEGEQVLFRVALDDRAAADASTEGAEPVEPLGATAESAVRSFSLTEDVHGKYGPQFFINGEFWPFNAPIHGALGALEVWKVKNDMPGDHPFHLHGMRFQVLSRGGAGEERLGWKDTVNLHGGEAVRFAVRYEAAGMWMYHCQIPEHAERGMMGEIHVETPP
jgi:FtsP/CotA-like multicopper oxidase with cupredoxin domain